MDGLKFNDMAFHIRKYYLLCNFLPVFSNILHIKLVIFYPPNEFSHYAFTIIPIISYSYQDIQLNNLMACALLKILITGNTVAAGPE